MEIPCTRVLQNVHSKWNLKDKFNMIAKKQKLNRIDSFSIIQSFHGDLKICLSVVHELLVMQEFTDTGGGPWPEPWAFRIEEMRVFPDASLS